ncbi:hypothetical protein ACTMU2_05420 [Cupriavidus basilensis]
MTRAPWPPGGDAGAAPRRGADRRVRRRLVLTDTGREYAARIRRHLDHPQRDTQEITTGPRHGLHAGTGRSARPSRRNG